MRWMRAMRCSRTAGFHGKSMFTRVEACCRLRPVLPASEHAAGGVVAKPLDQDRPFFRWHTAVEAHVTQATRFEATDDDVVGPRPLRKHHRLGVGLDEQILEQRRQFVCLDPMVGFLVQKRR